MFKKILVCLDGSPLAEQIIPYAREQALRFSSKLILLQVITATDALATPTTLSGDPLPEASQPSIEIAEAESNAAKTYLTEIAVSLEEKDLHVKVTAIFDPLPGEAIVEYARKHEVDLIAMATHGRSGIGRAVSGSIADHVLRESYLPILLIRPREIED